MSISHINSNRTYGKVCGVDSAHDGLGLVLVIDERRGLKLVASWQQTARLSLGEALCFPSTLVPDILLRPRPEIW